MTWHKLVFWRRFIRFRVTAAREGDSSCQGIHFGASQEKELRGLQASAASKSKKPSVTGVVHLASIMSFSMQKRFRYTGSSSHWNLSTVRKIQDIFGRTSVRVSQ